MLPRSRASAVTTVGKSVMAAMVESAANSALTTG
jgi:hypothetical protein